MNLPEPFIRRPVATTLLAIGLFLVGAVAYFDLPVQSMPTVEMPTIRVSASRPGADPETMAATVAAPLERRLGEISGVTEMTSRSSLGSTSITLQFDINRNVDAAARDVQAAINAALSNLPADLQSRPNFRKANPAAMPVLILAMTSTTMAASGIYDVADSIVAQRLSQVDGVAEVTVNGAEQPAIRIRVNPTALSSMGLSMEDVRSAVVAANASGPVGIIDGEHRAMSLGINGQLRAASQYEPIIVKAADGAVVRLSAIASVEQGTRNARSFGWFNRQPSVLLVINKQADANVIDTVDRIKALLPELKRFLPAGVDISVLSDRTTTIRASVLDMQLTLLATAILVMFVVFAFLRRGAATLAAGVTVPLSLAGTCAAMWLAGFTVNNLTLMALAISVGFVVDDAIVMIENVFRNLEKGLKPLAATLAAASQIWFTVISISVSLIAAFIPLLFMGGVVGRIFHEFSLTMTFAIAISALVSLTVTPMICALLVRHPPSPDATRFDRVVEWAMGGMVRFYARTLHTVLDWKGLTLVVMAATMALTAALYIKTPKGYFPQDDTGLVMGSVRAANDTSFEAMAEMQQRVTDIIMADPAVANVGSSIGGGGPGGGGSNRGSLFIALKPLSERDPTPRVLQRLRQSTASVVGVSVGMFPMQDVRIGARIGDSSYQFTLWSPNVEDVRVWPQRVAEKLKEVPGLVDVGTDREQGGLQANILIDRAAASRLGVRMADITNALNNAFSQRQISTIYTQRNQYRVILEIDPRYQRDPTDLEKVLLTGRDGAQIPLTAVVRVERGLAPLSINHQGQFPSVTIWFGLDPDMTLEAATRAIDQVVAELHVPESLRADFAGDARAYRQSIGAQPLLILAALIAVYIVLGVLYESLIHPLAIISTLPSAGLGALLALQMFGTELSLIAFIGIILLIGIVKKNGIMMVDFALEGERERGLAPRQAIYEASLARFRPIMMTTLAALLGALPLVLATGPGSELRRPLGITIIGGLVVSQMLTLYTTPVIYLMLDKLRRHRDRQLPRWRRTKDDPAGGTAGGTAPAAS